MWPKSPNVNIIIGMGQMERTFIGRKPSPIWFSFEKRKKIESVFHDIHDKEAEQESTGQEKLFIIMHYNSYFNIYVYFLP